MGSCNLDGQVAGLASAGFENRLRWYGGRATLCCRRRLLCASCNKFWRVIHEVGLTPRLFAPAEFTSLLDHGIGFTDLAKRAAGMDRQIAANLYDLDAFATKLNYYKPAVIAFSSKKAASVWLRSPTRRTETGRLVRADATSSDVFILPSPSGAAARYWSSKPWQELASWRSKT